MFQMYRIPKGDNAMTYKQYTPQELANEVNSNQPAIKVGDHVRLLGNDEYLGKIVGDRTIRYFEIQDNDGGIFLLNAKDVELAPRLTPDEAWAELPYLVLAQLNQRMSWGAVRLMESDQKQIRHEAYKLLGGAGIKVDEPAKERVRKAISRIADAMGVELA